MARFLYAKASHITPVTDVKYQKILDCLDSQESLDFRLPVEPGKHFIAVYTGLIGIAQGVGVIVEAAHFFKDNPDIHFLIVGDGGSGSLLLAFAVYTNNLAHQVVLLIPEYRSGWEN